jgi:hypothetical protein
MQQDIAYYPIHIVQGNDFELVLEINNKNCETDELEPIDFTTQAVSAAESFLIGLDGTELLEFETEIILPNQIKLTLNNLQTSTLIGQQLSKATETIGTWYANVIYADGTIETKMRGKAALTSLRGI